MYVNLFERHNTSWVESISRSAASKLAPPSGGKRRQAAALQNNGQSLASSKTYGDHHPSRLLASGAFEITG